MEATFAVAIIVAVSTAVGGVGTAIVTKLLNKKDKQKDGDRLIYAELVDENKELRDRIEILEQRLDRLRNDHFALRGHILIAYTDAHEYQKLYHKLSGQTPEHWLNNDPE